ncbi:hypothetical protein I302_101310 [Kwoniella bestiolae CBS 10118]|uniref:Uncharacterized protein n=1 Tax=Kwoniella bestiolae CBS 10118 TaxID=1296100 RepID=A0A1B9G7K2_9TREE|nr:hypothetical protein I302_04684 [Kwoniella bestiolae CBS 10118]OCF26992.1 hypothetical protein I302_04684 [Kwoniella bestiolae CBS 10118]
MVSQKICIEFFKNNLWMKDAERRGLVVKTEEGEWKATSKWNSGVANPISSRVLHLRKRFNEGWYRHKHGVARGWTRFEDIPDRRKRSQHPQPELHVPSPNDVRPDPPSRRRKRSPSTISSSSDSSGSEENVPLPSSRPHAKKPRKTYSELLRDTVTPLRALSISLPPDVPPQPEHDIIRYGMKPNVVYSEDSDTSSSSSSRDTTPPRDETLHTSAAPPSPAPSDSPSVVALSIVPDYWSRPPPAELAVVGGSSGDITMTDEEKDRSAGTNTMGLEYTEEEERINGKSPLGNLDWDALLKEITENPVKSPVKACVFADMAIRTDLKAALYGIASKAGLGQRTFQIRVSKGSIRQLFIRILTRRKKHIGVTTDYKKKKAKVTWMSPMAFLRFVKDEQEKVRIG